MNQTHPVQAHYTVPDMSARIEEALQQAGIGPGPIDWLKLAPLDQFHVRGLPATKELAEGLGLKGGENILDVGSGLGGPARYLAAVHGCYVTGIELTPLFVEIAGQLSERTGLSSHLRFVQGDALDMHFPDNSFDHAWTQHVAMNIRDKERLYRGIYRVLKPAGRFAIYDVVKGANEDPVYPLPWASEPGISFLVSPSEMREALRIAGFRELSSVDTTGLALAWFGEVQKAQAAPGASSSLNLGNLIGANFQQALSNLARNLRDGRLRLMEVVVEKARA